LYIRTSYVLVDKKAISLPSLSLSCAQLNSLCQVGCVYAIRLC